LVHNLPFARNPDFIGRQDELAKLHAALAPGAVVALCQPVHSLVGLGGVARPSSPWSTPTATWTPTAASSGSTPRARTSWRSLPGSPRPWAWISRPPWRPG